MAGERSARNGSANGRRNDEKAELEYLSLEAALQELDGIVATLEDGQLTLDDSLTLYERGMRLTKRCQEMLDTAELRVQRLRPASPVDGGFGGRAGFVLEHFEADDDE